MNLPDALAVPPRPEGPPPDVVATVLGAAEELFVWSPCQLNYGAGTLVITSDRVLYLTGADFLLINHPLNDRSRGSSYNHRANAGPLIRSGRTPDLRRSAAISARAESSASRRKASRRVVGTLPSQVSSAVGARSSSTLSPRRMAA